MDASGPLDAAVRERLVEAARLAAVGRLVPSLAHQLSTPLASISLRAESLAKVPGEAGAPAGRAERYLRAMIDDTERCKELLGVIRDFARPPGERGPADMNAACRGAARLVLHEALRRQIDVRTELADALPVLVGDEVRLRSAVLWLVLNGIDASPAAGTVTLRTRSAAGTVLVDVVDEGEGFDERERARLFEPFSSRRAGGVGVSLMACRIVAEAHGGAVEAEARPPRGSCFTLRLPAPGGPPRSRDGA
jgi:signal transduction histidine kinase